MTLKKQHWSIKQWKARSCCESFPDDWKWWWNFFSVFEWFLNYLTASVGPESYYLSLYNLHTVTLPPPKGVLQAWYSANCLLSTSQIWLIEESEPWRSSIAPSTEEVWQGQKVQWSCAYTILMQINSEAFSPLYLWALTIVINFLDSPDNNYANYKQCTVPLRYKRR